MNKLLIRSILYVLRAVGESLESFKYEYGKLPVATSDETYNLHMAAHYMRASCKHLEELL